MNALLSFWKDLTNVDRPVRLLDWYRAADIIVAHGTPTLVEAGLREDWRRTRSPIYRSGAPILQGRRPLTVHSRWATPCLKIGDSFIACYIRWEDPPPGWEPDRGWTYAAVRRLAQADMGAHEAPKA